MHFSHPLARNAGIFLVSLMALMAAAGPPVRAEESVPVQEKLVQGERTGLEGEREPQLPPVQDMLRTGVSVTAQSRGTETGGDE